MLAGVGGEAGAARRAVEERAAEHRDEIVVRRRDVAVADVQVGGEVGAVQAVDDAGVWGGEGDGRRGGRDVGWGKREGRVPSRVGEREGAVRAVVVEARRTSKREHYLRTRGLALGVGEGEIRILRERGRAMLGRCRGMMSAPRRGNTTGRRVDTRARGREGSGTTSNLERVGEQRACS